MTVYYYYTPNRNTYQQESELSQFQGNDVHSSALIAPIVLLMSFPSYIQTKLILSKH